MNSKNTEKRSMEKEKILTNGKMVALLAVLCTILWGTAFPGVKSSYQLYHIESTDIASTMLLAGIRFLLAGVIVIAYMTISNRQFILPSKQSIGLITLTGFVQTGLQYSLFYIAMANTSGVKGAILGSTTSFYSIILSHFLFKDDKLNYNKVFGCIIGFLGIIILNLKGNDGFIGFSLLGDGTMLISTFMAALGAIISKMVTKYEHPILITGYQMFIGSSLLIIIGLVSGGKLSYSGPRALLLLVYLSALSAVAFSLWTVLHKYNNAGKIAIYNFLIPIFGTVFSAIFLKEQIFHIRNVIALICVCFGILIVNRKRS